jgi:hypothetical protein
MFIVHDIIITPEQIRSSDTNRFSAGEEISLFYGNRRFMTAFTTARPCSSSAAI